MPEPAGLELPERDRLLEEARRLVASLEALPAVLQKFADQDTESAAEVAERTRRRLRWLLRMRRAIFDVGAVTAANSVTEALSATQHLAEYTMPSYASSPRLLVADRPGPADVEPELQVLHSYVDTTSREVADRYMGALRHLLDIAGYEVVVEGIDEWGSWFKRVVVRARHSDAPRRLAEGVAMAAQDTYVRLPAASATRELAEAAKAALDAIGDNEGCQVFDNLIVLKWRRPDGSLTTVVSELSLEQRRLLRERPALITSPATVLHELQRMVGVGMSETASLPTVRREIGTPSGRQDGQ